MESVPLSPNLPLAVAQWTAPVLDIASVLALLVGGTWAYFLFIRKRVSYPHADVRLKVKTIGMPDNILLLRVSLWLENKGNILLEPSAVTLYVQKVLPWPADELGATPRQAVVQAGAREIDWPSLCEFELKASENTLPVKLIEPHESDAVHFDCLVPDNTEVVLVYAHVTAVRSSFFRKPAKEGPSVGWTASELYRIQREDHAGGA